jgi:hypothetical protein
LVLGIQVFWHEGFYRFITQSFELLNLNLSVVKAVPFFYFS